MTRHIGRCIIAATAIALFAPRLARSQGHEVPKGRIAVTLALVDEYHYGEAPGVIVRQAAPHPRNIIVLPAASAAPDDAVAAAMMLNGLMAYDGDSPQEDGLFLVTRVASVPARETAAAAKILRVARAATPDTLAGIGLARSSIMYLPNAETRLAMKAKKPKKEKDGSTPAP